MFKKSSGILIGLIFCFAAIPGKADIIDVAEYSAFINASEFGPGSLQHTDIGYSYDDFTASGLDVVFTNSLNSANRGTVTWSVTNTSGMDLTNVWFYGFLDAQIDEATTSFFNETVDSSNLTLGSGSSDNIADTWETDEPGFIFGDIFSNLLVGSLDNTNGTLGIEEDIALALGFDLGTLLSTQTLVATFEISDTNNGGLYQYDPLSGYGFYFNGFVDVVGSVGVPEPPTLLLMMMGALFLLRNRYKGKV